MPLTGCCHCGVIRYELSGTDAPRIVPLHRLPPRVGCADGRLGDVPRGRTDGHPGRAARIRLVGTWRRYFCGTCGTGLFYRNAQNLPGIVDTQAATLDDPDALPAGAHIQVAERIGWMKDAHTLPEFARYPGMA